MGTFSIFSKLDALRLSESDEIKQQYQKLLSFVPTIQPDWVDDEYIAKYVRQVDSNQRIRYLTKTKPKMEDSSPIINPKRSCLDHQEISDLETTLDQSCSTLCTEYSPDKFFENSPAKEIYPKHINFSKRGISFGPLGGVRQRYPGISYEAMHEIIKSKYIHTGKRILRFFALCVALLFNSKAVNYSYSIFSRRPTTRY